MPPITLNINFSKNVNGEDDYKSSSNDGSLNGKEASQQNQDETCQSSTPSLLSDLQLHSTEMGEIAEMPDYECLSTSAVLYYCKHKILRPYLRLLSVMGLRPSNEETEYFSRYCILANFHTFQVILFMCMGYVLQYLACYRRDRGFCYVAPTLEVEMIPKTHSYSRTCHGSATFAYFVPSALHLVAYLYTVYLFRVKENEQLQNLMERAFLLSFNPANRGGQKRLVRILWLFIGLGVLWIISALTTVTSMTAKETVNFQYLWHSSSNLKIVLKVFLVLCTLWHDMVQGTIITSYCLQAQLLISHLYFLRLKLIQHSMSGLEWMKEVSEFRKLLKYFNDEYAPAVCIYTAVNISWAISGTAWLLKYDSQNSDTDPLTWINIVNVILWISIALAPFIQAARLTTTCSMIQSIGHEVRVRPFVYQSTPGEDLDTLLLFTSTLKMCARLYRVPITGRYLCLFLTVGGVTSLILGQCQFFA